MDRLIYHNDRITDAAEAGVSPTIAGLLYGWGVFSTLRIVGGAPFLLDRHWERLVRHAEKIGVPAPQDYIRVHEAVRELIGANSVREGRMRITLLKGDAGAWRAGPRPESELLIFTSPVVGQKKEDLSITISPHRLPSHGPLAGVKRTSMLENLLAFEEARSRGFAEAVMLNERGEIVSATAGNIFWIEGDEVFTPSASTGCVAGITRGLVYDIAKRLRMHLIEGGFPIQRLLDAREVFLTSTARGVAPVTSFDIRQYRKAESRMTRLIAREFQKIISDVRISP